MIRAADAGGEINKLLDEIERRFHLVRDTDGADLTYRLRERIAKLKRIHHNLVIECAATRRELEKKNPRR